MVFDLENWLLQQQLRDAVNETDDLIKSYWRNHIGEIIKEKPEYKHSEAELRREREEAYEAQENEKPKLNRKQRRALKKLKQN